MPTLTTTYSFEKPIVGSELDSWGDDLNSNWDLCDDLFDGTTPVVGIDINGGAIDGTPIGANSASTGAFTTLSASGDITGNLKGDILSPDGTVILDSGTTDGADATFTGTASSLLDCTATGAELSTLASSGMTAEKMANLADLSVAEVDILDGATITTDELNHLANATSEIQTQIDAKQATMSAGTNIDISSNTIHASGCPDVVVGCTKSGTGGVAVYTSYNIPVTQEIVDKTGGASVSNNCIHLPAGTYYFEGTAILRNTSSYHDVGWASLQLYTDDGAAIGTECSHYMGERASTNFLVVGTFTTAGDGFRLVAKSDQNTTRIQWAQSNSSATRQQATIKFWKSDR